MLFLILSERVRQLYFLHISEHAFDVHIIAEKNTFQIRTISTYIINIINKYSKNDEQV